MWRIALGVAIGVVAAAVIVVPASTLWDETVLKPNIDALPGEVKLSLQSTLDSDEAYREYNLRVESLVLMKTGENIYTGLARIKPANRQPNEIAVTIYYDGERMFWNTEPGAFMWLLNTDRTSTGGG
jgi:hypothetical protein